MNIFIALVILLLLLIVASLYWIYGIIRLFFYRRYKSAITQSFVFVILLFGILWELRIIPIASTNDFKNKTLDLTGKQFWSWNNYRYEEIGVRGEGYTFEIYDLSLDIAKYFEDPPSSFFEDYPTEKYSYSKWKRTPIQDDELGKLEFVTPVYGNWDENKKQIIKEKLELVKQIMTENGSFYTFDTVIWKDVTLYLIAPKQKLIVQINHNM